LKSPDTGTFAETKPGLSLAASTDRPLVALTSTSPSTTVTVIGYEPACW
jgi:hypothetical protein